MLDAIDMLWILCAAVSLVCVVGFAALLSLYKRQGRQLEQAQSQLQALSSNLTALCSGAVGVDKRVTRLERTGRAFREWQENMQSHGSEENAFGRAIQLVRRGATAGKLVEDLGLSRNEADLIVMLHGMKEAS